MDMLAIAFYTVYDEKERIIIDIEPALHSRLFPQIQSGVCDGGKGSVLHKSRPRALGLRAVGGHNVNKHLLLLLFARVYTQ